MNVDILAAEGISKQFDGFAALSDVDIVLRKGERVGLIGPNGIRQEYAGQLSDRNYHSQ